MKKYPQTEKYDVSWIEKNWMGPNPLWLLEELCGHIDLRPGMKVLDMGCGKGITSIFLAKEYGVTVFANDLWISATDNLCRFQEAQVADKVFPIHSEAHALPYAEGFFDAAIAIDCYHYFGASESYFPDVFSKLVKHDGQFGIVVPGLKGSESYFPDVFSKLVKHDGQFGIVVPGLKGEYEKGYPETLEKLWFPELFTFHSNKWWRSLWEKTGLCEITSCYDIDDAKAIWQPWANWAKENFEKEFGDVGGGGDFDAKFLEADANNDITLIVLAARKTLITC